MARSSRRHDGSRSRIAALLLVAALVAGACTDGGGDGGATSSTTATTATTSGPPSTDVVAPGGGPVAVPAAFTGVRLSTGTATAPPAEPVPTVTGTPLDDAAVQAVVDRLPAWTPGDVTTAPFAFPAESVAPPAAGVTPVAVPFPSADPTVPVDVPTGPLHVVRTQPEGEVAIAPFVSITFDQPMVPVGTVGQLADEQVPASISPAVPGHWQWIGTTTLRFDADDDLVDRLPMATAFTVTVPAGTTSATGGSLAEPVTWTFATPSPTVQSFEPVADDLPLTPVFLATFDQRIDPAAVLATVVVQADGSAHEMRLATADELAAEADLQAVVDGLPADRWLAFRPIEPFAADASITIDVGPATPSAEGPRTSAEPATYEAHTYSPLAIESMTCMFGDACFPGGGLTVGLNNVLDPDLFDPASVRVEPPIVGAFIGVYDSSITINGATLAATTYTVTLPAGLTDVHGQQLGQEQSRTVTVGDAQPFLQPFGQRIVTLDPSAATPAIAVVSSGYAELRVRVFAVDPSVWPTDQGAPISRAVNGDPDAPVPNRPVLLDTVVPVDGEVDATSETTIDLGATLPEGHGHVLVRVEPAQEPARDSQAFWSSRPITVWVQRTDIGLDAFTDGGEVRSWATDLSTGAVLPGVTLQLAGRPDTAVTGADGIASLPFAASSGEPWTLSGTLGADTALLPGDWAQPALLDATLWYVFADRGVYRPGETVTLKGWERRFTTSGDAQLELWGDAPEVHYTARDGQGNVLAEGTAATDPLGGFDLTFDVPPGANLGYASVDLRLGDGVTIPSTQTNVAYRIEEFRRPEFEVTARTESAGPYLRAAPLTVAADAAYYAGGPLGDAPVSWQVTTSAAAYSPPGWEDFTFGRSTPWSDDGFGGGMPRPFGNVPIVDGACCRGPGPGPDSDVETYAGTTDAAGSQYMQIGIGDLDDDLDGLPVTVTAQATVTDVNRQPISSTTSVLVHPAALYVGLQSERNFVRRGEPLDVTAIVTDVDGNAVAGRAIEVTASRVESVFAGGTWTDEAVDTQTCAVTSSADPAACSFTTDTGGTYEIASTIVDDEGRGSRSELTTWVSAADRVPSRRVELEQLTIVPDKAEHQPGDTAELLVQAPFATGTGLLTVARFGIVSTTTFELADGSPMARRSSRCRSPPATSPASTSRSRWSARRRAPQTTAP